MTLLPHLTEPVSRWLRVHRTREGSALVGLALVIGCAMPDSVVALPGIGRPVQVALLLPLLVAHGVTLCAEPDYDLPIPLSSRATRTFVSWFAFCLLIGSAVAVIPSYLGQAVSPAAIFRNVGFYCALCLVFHRLALVNHAWLATLSVTLIELVASPDFESERALNTAGFLFSADADQTSIVLSGSMLSLAAGLRWSWWKAVRSRRIGTA